MKHKLSAGGYPLEFGSKNSKHKALKKAKQDKGITMKRQNEHDSSRSKAIADNWMRKLKNE